MDYPFADGGFHFHCQVGPVYIVKNMLLEAMCDFEAEPDETLYVGDRPEDEEAARNAGVTFQWSQDFFGDKDVSNPL